jgi:hypothetical protein
MSDGRITVKLEGQDLQTFEALRWKLQEKSHASLGKRFLLEAIAANRRLLEEEPQGPPPKGKSGEHSRFQKKGA